MGEILKQTLERSIQFTDQIIKEANFACSFKQECADIKSQTEYIGGLLRLITPAINDLYEPPTRRIINNTEQVLHKTLQLVFKCKATGLRRVFTIIPTADAIQKSSKEIGYSIWDVSWLKRISTGPQEFLAFPPIAADTPTLCVAWGMIAGLCCGTLDDRADAAALLCVSAQNSDRFRRMIIEEGGVPLLLKLAKEGTSEGQENAMRAICLLGGEPVDPVVNGRLCLLEDGHMKVQISFTEAEPEPDLAAGFPSGE